MPGELYHFKGAAAIPFYILQASGGLSAALGAARLDPLELAGMRQASAATSPTLQTHGIYGYVRHPLYLGWVLLVWGTHHMTTDHLLFAALTTAYLMIAVPFEERGLISTFGRAYESYQQRVRWRILPGLY
jgi:protein-S-isoprenylcysteine O-methyltransferase Ste14